MWQSCCTLVGFSLRNTFFTLGRSQTPCLYYVIHYLFCSWFHFSMKLGWVLEQSGITYWTYGENGKIVTIMLYYRLLHTCSVIYSILLKLPNNAIDIWGKRKKSTHHWTYGNGKMRVMNSWLRSGTDNVCVLWFYSSKY